VEVHEFNFLEAFSLAAIYLDNETDAAMRNVLGSFRQMCTSIWLRLPSVFESHGQHADAAIREPDWQLFTTSVDGAIVKIKTLLSPGTQ